MKRNHKPKAVVTDNDDLCDLKKRYQYVSSENVRLHQENNRLRELVERLSEHVAKESAYKRETT